MKRTHDTTENKPNPLKRDSELPSSLGPSNTHTRSSQRLQDFGQRGSRPPETFPKISSQSHQQYLPMRRDEILPGLQSFPLWNICVRSELGTVRDDKRKRLPEPRSDLRWIQHGQETAAHRAIVL